MWRLRRNDQQNPHVSPRPLQEEAAGGGLRGSQDAVWTGRLSVGFVLGREDFHVPIVMSRCGDTGACWTAWLR